MVEANVKIIEELKYFLDTITSDSSIRGLVTRRESDFIRDRKLPFNKVVGLLINLPKRSLSVELNEFFESLGQGCELSTKGAFSLQRTKLRPLFFEAWNRWLVNCFYYYYGCHVKRWRGFRVLAVDGSSAYLMNKKEVIDYFGTQDNQHVSIAMARVVQVHDVLNDLTVWGDIRPIGQSEHTIITEQVSQLYEDSLTLFDRGYPSYTLMYRLLNEEKPRHFVMRCKTIFNSEVRQFVKSRKTSKIVELTPTAGAIASLYDQGYKVSPSTTIKIRMVKIKLSSGQTEILLTNLYDDKQYSLEDLKYLYGLRWTIETTYNKQKNQQQMEQFSGHRVICIKQDYAASLVVANLQSLIEKQCEPYLNTINSKRKYRYRINRNISWAGLKHNIVKLFLSHDITQILSKLQQEFQRNVEPIRPGRGSPRVVKAKRLKGKYQTFTNYKRAI